jgi:hypothetical protein
VSSDGGAEVNPDTNSIEARPEDVQVCSAVQRSAVQCRAVQGSAVQCSAVAWAWHRLQLLFHVQPLVSIGIPCAVQCSVVQCSAVQCSAVQCSAVGGFL